MKVGFTGTQQGMTEAQKKRVEGVLLYLGALELHHGDCIGADADVHEIGRALKLQIVLHPPDVSRKRAFCDADVEKEPLPYLVRNKNIVRCTERLVATPRTVQEELRSGTWATIRFARKQGKQVYIVPPSGELMME